jgi:hypothetical protein
LNLTRKPIVKMMAPCSTRTAWTWATQCKWFETLTLHLPISRTWSWKSIKWPEAIIGAPTIPALHQYAVTAKENKGHPSTLTMAECTRTLKIYLYKFSHRLKNKMRISA